MMKKQILFFCAILTAVLYVGCNRTGSVPTSSTTEQSTTVGSPANAYMVISDQKIYNVSVTMEYSLDDKSSWTDCGGAIVESVPFEVGNQVWVRQQDQESTECYLGLVSNTSGYPDLVSGDIYIGTGSFNNSDKGVIPGEAMSLRPIIGNSGDTIASGTITVEFYFSTDKTITTADTKFYEYTGGVSIAAGSSQKLYINDAATIPSISPGQYYVGCIIDTTDVITELCEDNNITTPENLDLITILDPAALSDGAVKIVNSWGTASSFENIHDGHYWVTYDTMKAQEMMIYYYHNDFSEAYQPTVVAVFNINHSYRDEAIISIGLGDPADPVEVKKFQSTWNTTTTYPGHLAFPDTNMALDISEFSNYINEYDVFLLVENSGSTTGTIDSFHVDFYSDFNSSPFKTITSTDTPEAIAASTTSSVTALTAGTLSDQELIDIAPANRSYTTSPLIEEMPSTAELAEDIGDFIYEEGVNYNKIVDGYGTGLVPPTLEEWQKMPKLRAVVSTTRAPLPDSLDHSQSKYFPPIGNQGSEGSCVCFALGYYVGSFQQAKKNDWDLSTISWTGLWPGAPNSKLDQLMSPDFVYHQVNYGTDGGSSYTVVASFINRVGISSFNTMPNQYDDNHTYWPDEDAYKEAGKYRGKEVGNPYWGYTTCGYFAIISDADIDMLKRLLNEGYIMATAVYVNDFYDLMDGNDVIDRPDVAKYASTNHAQTIVGYKQGTAWDPTNPDS